MSSSASYRQELPPPSGYKPIQFERIPARKVIGSYATWAFVAASFVVGHSVWRLQNKKNIRLHMEYRGARYALRPMMVAERDRAYLKQLRINRDEEERLMANVPGWEVGTLYGKPIFKTRPADEWHDPTTTEYFIHNSELELHKHTLLQKLL
jgi:NADH dehydrogenase (ubiquinone) 1 alpha subcomplex subunit 13